MVQPHRKGSRAALSRAPAELFYLVCVLLRPDRAHGSVFIPHQPGYSPQFRKGDRYNGDTFQDWRCDYKLFDIGDQKGEQRTCIRYFKNIAGLLFLANMYEQVRSGIVWG